MVPAIEGISVTEHVVDVVAALATRARSLLLSPLTLLEDNDDGSGSGGGGTSTATTTTTMGSPVLLLPLEFELHEHTVRLLWQWSRDGSGTTHPLDYL